MFRYEDGRLGRFLEAFDQELRAQIGDNDRRQQAVQSKHQQSFTVDSSEQHEIHNLPRSPRLAQHIG
jgi:hypothetical protein